MDVVSGAGWLPSRRTGVLRFFECFRRNHPPPWVIESLTAGHLGVIRSTSEQLRTS
jgi:hypothetical protein